MMIADYTKSYYSQTINTDTRRESLSAELEVDVCVVGAGLAGLSTALSLAERGRKVAVVEARKVGWGASGRNGGFVGAGFALGEEALVKSVGLEDARALYDLSRDGVSLVRSRIKKYAIECPPNELGGLRPSCFDDADALHRRRDFMAETLNEQAQFWPRERVRDVLRTSRYYDALFRSDSFQFHPLNYCRGVAGAAERLGAEVFEDSTVTSVSRAAGTYTVATTSGQIKARDVVMTCGGYLTGLVPRLQRAIVPIATYVIATEPLGEERMNDVIRVPYTISDDKFANDYYRRMPDSRILWGGRISVRQSRPPDLSALMRRDLLKIYPQLADIRIETAWHGLMSYAVHKMPQIGQLEPGLWYAMAFGGHGMNTTGMAGELLAAAIADDDDRYRLFAPFGLTPTGGPIGAAAAQLTYWYYQVKDRLRGA